MTICRKTRTDGRLARLTAEQQQQVIAHCESVTLEEGMHWLKNQFNITLSRTSLARWLEKKRAHRAISARLERIRNARDQAMVIGNAVGSATEIAQANVAMISQAVFEELIKPEDQRDEAKLAEYISIGLKLRGLDIRARTNDIAHERLHFDEAKRALASAGKLQRINDSGADERTKIEQAMVLLFGKPVTVED